MIKLNILFHDNYVITRDNWEHTFWNLSVLVWTIANSCYNCDYKIHLFTPGT